MSDGFDHNLTPGLGLSRLYKSSEKKAIIISRSTSQSPDLIVQRDVYFEPSVFYTHNDIAIRVGFSGYLMNEWLFDLVSASFVTGSTKTAFRLSAKKKLQYNIVKFPGHKRQSFWQTHQIFPSQKYDGKCRRQVRNILIDCENSQIAGLSYYNI